MWMHTNIWKALPTSLALLLTHHCWKTNPSLALWCLLNIIQSSSFSTSFQPWNFFSRTCFIHPFLIPLPCGPHLEHFHLYSFWSSGLAEMQLPSGFFPGLALSSLNVQSIQNISSYSVLPCRVVTSSVSWLLVVCTPVARTVAYPYNCPLWFQLIDAQSIFLG